MRINPSKMIIHEDLVILYHSSNIIPAINISMILNNGLYKNTAIIKKIIKTNDEQMRVIMGVNTTLIQNYCTLYLVTLKLQVIIIY